LCLLPGATIADANLQATMKIYRQVKIEFQLRATPARTEYRLTNLHAGRYCLQAGKRGIAGPGIRTFIPMMYPEASRFEEDLDTGEWQRRYGELLEKEELDIGYRLVVGHPTRGPAARLRRKNVQRLFLEGVGIASARTKSV